MQCLVAALRPLRVEELAELLAFDFNVEGIPKLNPGWRWEDQEQAVMSACSSLVTIVEDGDSRIVQFSHFSVREYLTSDRLAKPIKDVSRYHIRLDTAHTILAQACFGAILRLDDRVDSDNMENFPLARYAAQYLATHARFESASSRTKDGMKCLFDGDRPHFATWLWIYNDVAVHGDVEILRVLLEHGGNVGAEDKEGRTLLHVATNDGRIEVVRVLLEHGADVNAQANCHSTPLHAAACGSVEISLALIEHGANIGAEDNEGKTSLHVAARHSIKVVRLLLEHGADVNAQANCHSTPLHAAACWSVEISRVLIEHGANIGAEDYLGRTPLHVAAQHGNIEVVRMLFECGADIHARGNYYICT